MVPITINYFACFVQRSSWPETGVASMVSGMVCQGMPNKMGDKEFSNDTEYQNNKDFSNQQEWYICGAILAEVLG